MNINENMPKYKIAIAGAGLGGLAAASFLARAGHDVTVFERSAELKAQGSGLLIQPSGLAVLSLLDLDQKVIANGARVDALHGETPKGKVIVDLRYKDIKQDLFGIGIHRGALFKILLQKAKELNVAFVTGSNIDSAELENGRRVLWTADHISLGEFDLVIDATGHRSSLRKHGKTGAFKPYDYGALWTVCRDSANIYGGHTMEQRYKGAGTMIGIMPIGTISGRDGNHIALFHSMRKSLLSEWKKKDFDAWKKETAKIWPDMTPYLDQIESQDQLTFAPYVHATMKRWHAERLAFMGDAAHSSSPQLGQGANMAFIDALTLTEKISSHENLQDALKAYSATRRSHIRFHQKATRIITPFFQSASAPAAFVRDRMLPIISRIPYAKGQMTKLFAGVKKGLFKKLDPGQWNKTYGF